MAGLSGLLYKMITIHRNSTDVIEKTSRRHLTDVSEMKLKRHWTDVNETTSKI